MSPDTAGHQPSQQGNDTMNNDNEKTTGLGQGLGVEQSHVDEIKTSHSVDELEYSANDIEKQRVVKGDDSDGRVEWSTQQILATLALSALYVGMCSL